MIELQEYCAEVYNVYNVPAASTGVKPQDGVLLSLGVLFR